MKPAVKMGRMPLAPISFTKMHGLKNDYVVLDATTAPVADAGALARAVTDRRTGVGSDGLLLAEASEVADLRMRMFNPDGSEAEMCGNGLRCLAFFAARRGLVADPSAMSIETGAGVLPARVEDRGGAEAQVTVGMGTPALLGPLALTVAGVSYDLLRVSMGNPHAVILVEDVDVAPVAVVGPRIETDAAFPDRTNVEFVQVLGDGALRVRTWERGAGETLACGTGACAAVVAAATWGLTGRALQVGLLGGDVAIEWHADESVSATGPAVFVYEGVWPTQEGGGS